MTPRKGTSKNRGLAGAAGTVDGDDHDRYSRLRWPLMSSLGWILQVAGLCVVPLALMGGLAQGDIPASVLPTLELRILMLGAGLFLVGRWASARNGKAG